MCVCVLQMMWDAMQAVHRDVGGMQGGAKADSGASEHLGGAEWRSLDQSREPVSRDSAASPRVPILSTASNASPGASSSAAASKRGVWSALRGFLGCSEPRQGSKSKKGEVESTSTCWGQVSTRALLLLFL